MGYDALRKISLSSNSLCQTTIQKQEEIARQIALDENPNLPVITMGIAATQGYEIEYPRPRNSGTMSHAFPEGFEAVTEDLGIHWGDGGDGCDEIAPGPFYHPKTMIAYFRLMQDLGFIDFYKYQGLTLHFNSGVGTRHLRYLILAQYLGNTLSDTSMFSRFSREHAFNFRIFGGLPGDVDEYAECKSFLCLTPAETELGLTQIGYLSWALKCYQGVGNHLGVKQMAAVWREYVADLNAGAKSVGLGGLFSGKGELREISPALLNQMIALVDEAVPNYRARFKDPDSITTANPVTLNGRQWPNVVAFARSIGNEAVKNIKSIERDINTKAQRQVPRIPRQ